MVFDDFQMQCEADTSSLDICLDKMRVSRDEDMSDKI
jgi:hypothetical protein